MVRAAALCTAAVLFLGGAASAAAQEPPVSRLILELMNISTVIGKGETGDHSQHFVPGLAEVSRPIYELNRAIAWQLAGFPLGPTQAVVVSRGASGVEQPRRFGAGYADSAFSLGAKRTLFSVSYQTTTFDTYDDQAIRGGVNLYIPHAPVTGDESDRDMMRQVISLRLNRKVVSFALGYGAGSRVSVGVVVPIVQVAADARIVTHIIRTASATQPAVHEFDIIDRANNTFPRACSPIAQLEVIDPQSLECHGSSTARGIGDIMLHGKVTLFEAASALAVSVDARLPSGNADDLIGLGAAQVKPALVWSVDAGRIGARARAEYTWSSGDLTSTLAEGIDGLDLGVPDEIGLGFGFDADILPHTTLAVDLMARRITDVPRFSSGSAVFPSRGPGPLPSASYETDDALLLGGGRDLTQVLGALGLRFDIPGGVMAQVSALFPVSGGGLKPQSMAVFSLTKRY